MANKERKLGGHEKQRPNQTSPNQQRPGYGQPGREQGREWK